MFKDFFLSVLEPISMPHCPKAIKEADPVYIRQAKCGRVMMGTVKCYYSRSLTLQSLYMSVKRNAG